MEPKGQGSTGGPERAPIVGGIYELAAPRLDVLTTNSPERELQPSTTAAQTEASQVAMPALPTPVLPLAQPGTTASDDASLPSTAADDDLIEKEWVDKAKKILSETRDDPYKREREISKLQIEYIRRRYGREIGDTGE